MELLYGIRQGKTEAKSFGPATKLGILQNKCLRSVTGAYKATNINVLEAESGVMPLNLYLDQTILRSRYNPRCGEVLDHAKEILRRKLRGKRGKRRQPGATPMAVKNKWSKEMIKRMHSQLPEAAQQIGRAQPSCGTIVKKWAFKRWRERWDLV